MANIIHLRMFDIALRIDTVFNLSRLGKRMRRALKVLHGFTDNVIQERRAELLAASRHDAAVAGDCDDIGTKRKSAFLDILLQARIDDEPLSDLDIREEVDTFMFEVSDILSNIQFGDQSVLQHIISGLRRVTIQPRPASRSACTQLPSIRTCSANASRRFAV